MAGLVTENYDTGLINCNEAPSNMLIDILEK